MIKINLNRQKMKIWKVKHFMKIKYNIMLKIFFGITKLKIIVKRKFKNCIMIY